MAIKTQTELKKEIEIRFVKDNMIDLIPIAKKLKETKLQDEIEKERYERYIEETIDGIKDYVRETQGEDINKYHHWKDMLEIVETFRVDMLSIIEEKGSQSQKKEVLEIIENKLKLTKSKWLKLSKEHCKHYNAPEGFVDKREHICGEKLCAIEGERMVLQELQDELK